MHGSACCQRHYVNCGAVHIKMRWGGGGGRNDSISGRVITVELEDCGFDPWLEQWDFFLSTVIIVNFLC